MQGNFVIGLIVFAILVIVNFVVITKGSGRIAEVAARFSLDAMPGKQMAIDADLSAGLIDEKEAKARRKNIEANPISSAPWTAPANSCAATPLPAC
jgi:flagellar biosynthesis protein FlhA